MSPGLCVLPCWAANILNEAKLGGPVQYRWMYPIERMLYQLKKLIRNMARPEGSIAEGYIAKECMTLCSRYLKGSKTKFNTFEQTCDNGFEKSEGEISIFAQCGRGIGAGMSRNLNDDEWEKAHIFILKNCDEVQPFLKEYSQIQEISTSQVSEDEWNRKFIIWFKKKVEKMRMQDQHTKYDALLSLSRGPSQYVRCFKGYVANGYRFRIEASDIKSRTQNSRVCVLGDIGNETNFVDYYGVLTEILELQYLDEKRLVLFRCKWFDVHDKEKGAKIDEYGFTSINCNRLLKTNEPFILASQASQVFYVNDNINKGWNVVVKMQPRDLYEMGQPVDEESINTDDLGEAYQHSESFNYDCNNSNSADADGQNIWIRTDSEPTIVDKTITKRKRKRKTF